MISGLTFWGSSHLPPDLVTGLDEIRAWADAAGLLSDDGQLVSAEDLREAGSVFERVMILVHLYIEPGSGRLSYLEAPYIEVATLINAAQRVRLVWWGLGADLMANDRFSEVRFGFWSGDSTIEYASGAVAPLVVQRFVDTHRSLPFAFTERSFEADMRRRWTEAADVDGRVGARFLRSGRKYDAELRIE